MKLPLFRLIDMVAALYWSKDHHSNDDRREKAKADTSNEEYCRLRR